MFFAIWRTKVSPKVTERGYACNFQYLFITGIDGGRGGDFSDAIAKVVRIP